VTGKFSTAFESTINSGFASSGGMAMLTRQRSRITPDSSHVQRMNGKAIMSIKNEGPAGWAVHPGEILREEFLEPMGISAYRLAVELHVSPPTVNDIVREKHGITPEMSARLAKYFGTSEQFWLNLQDAFAVHQVRRKYSKELKAIRPLATAAAR